MTSPLTPIESTIQALNRPVVDLQLLRLRYPELIYFFDAYEDLEAFTDDADTTIKQLRMALSELEKTIPADDSGAETGEKEHNK